MGETYEIEKMNRPCQKLSIHPMEYWGCIGHSTRTREQCMWARGFSEQHAPQRRRGGIGRRHALRSTSFGDDAVRIGESTDLRGRKENALP